MLERLSELSLSASEPSGSGSWSMLRRCLWLAIPLSILGVDIGLRWNWGWPPGFGEDPTHVLYSFGLSLWVWWAISRWVAAGERSWIRALVVALPVAAAVAMSWQYHSVVHKDVNTGVLIYFFMEPKTTVDLASTGWTLSFSWKLLLLSGAWTTCLAAGDAPEGSPILRAAQLLALVLWLGAAVVWPPASPVTGAHYVSDFHVGNLVASVGAMVATQDVGTGAIGRADDRADVPPASFDGDAPNVVVFLGETLIARRMGLYGYRRETTPEMTAFAERHDGELFHFDHAYASSPYTPLSDASILSGLSPMRDREALHRAPMLWEYGRAAGAETFLLTSKRWSWSNMQLFFLADDAPEVVETGDTMPAEVINAGGIDDRLLSPRFRRLTQERVSADTPLVGVFQTNATHYPYLVPESGVDWPLETSEDRYDAALTLVDGVFGEMVEALEASGRLDETIIVVVPDHREPFYDVTGRIADRRPEALTPDLRSGQRIESCHPSITHVPMFMYVPEAIQQRLAPEQLEALRANRERAVSAVDIVPTLLDAMETAAGATRDSERLERPLELDGRSLLQPTPARSPAICVTEPGWETTLKSGIGLFDPAHRFYVREDFRHAYTFDPAEPIRSDRPVGGRRAEIRDWAWVAQVADEHPAIARELRRIADKSPYHGLAERLRSLPSSP